MAIVANFFFAQHRTVIFFLSAFATIPLAHFLSESTEHLAVHTGPTIGGLLNVTLGNAGELLIGYFALRQGLDEVVKASITGSILGNLLLALGISIISAGVKKKTLKFNALAARTRATMLALAGFSLILPAAYHYAVTSRTPGQEADLSMEFSIILLITYGLSLLFTLRTHKGLLSPARDAGATDGVWTKRSAVAGLLLTSAFIGWISEILASSVEAAAKQLGLSDLFVGVIVIAIAGNAAEGLSAVRSALAGRMDLSVGICLGSSTQIALLAAPALVLISRFTGHAPMNLLFSPIEITALVLAMAITGQIAGDGDSNWFEGVQLLAVYLMLAAMFFLIPA
jgi:Ca2+:H+ antiporter